jgi:hypothetical protein
MASDMVYVGCKMPNGVILNLTRYEVISKEHGIVQRTGEELGTVRLKGNTFRQGFQVDTSIDGYVFTPVPKDFWEAWLKDHADSSLLKDGFIKPALSLDAGKKMAREHEAEPGMFPRLIEGDPRTKNFDPTLKSYDKDEAA